jgi:Mrp family chromosome partitioning ATPase
MQESNDSNKVELIGVTPQSDTKETLRRLVAALRKQGINVVPASKNSLLED